MCGSLIQIISMGIQDSHFPIEFIGDIISYDYDLVKNICDNYEFIDIKFIDYLNFNIDKSHTLCIDNFSKKYNNLAINCSNQNIKKIIINDKNIKYFNCSYNPIKHIDLSKSKIIFLIIENSIKFNLNFVKLPITLIYLDCSHCYDNYDKTLNNIIINFTKLKKLKYLIFHSNYLLNTDKIKLPNNIIYLDFRYCSLESFNINNNKNKIEYLLLKYNSLKKVNLSNLYNLKYLDISENRNFDFNPNNLPAKLKVLICSGTNSLEFYNLPLSLEKLDCSFTNIKILDYLPESLTWLNCSGTKTSNLDNLPIGLKYINYDETLFSEQIINNNNNLFFILPKKVKCFTNEINLNI